MKLVIDETLISKLQQDFPDIRFETSNYPKWSYDINVVQYSTNGKFRDLDLLHEVGHAKLGHSHFKTDLELLLQEVEAWRQAKLLSNSYGITFDNEYQENCLDSYRDWLYYRSTCPLCFCASLQLDNSNAYHCYNCNNKWTVSKNRFCRPYRLLQK
jgi:hypothetical protein